MVWGANVAKRSGGVREAKDEVIEEYVALQQ
jgi:hypothetical protein